MAGDQPDGAGRSSRPPVITLIRAQVLAVTSGKRRRMAVTARARAARASASGPDCGGIPVKVSGSTSIRRTVARWADPFLVLRGSGGA
jgi:hypothetical protein